MKKQDNINKFRKKERKGKKKQKKTFGEVPPSCNLLKGDENQNQPPESEDKTNPKIFLVKEQELCMWMQEEWEDNLLIL